MDPKDTQELGPSMEFLRNLLEAEIVEFPGNYAAMAINGLFGSPHKKALGEKPRANEPH